MPYTVVVLSGLRIGELVIGDGAVAGRGSRVTLHYSGYVNSGHPFQTDVVATFAVGERNTIAGLSWGVEGCASAVVVLEGAAWQKFLTVIRWQVCESLHLDFTVADENEKIVAGRTQFYAVLLARGRPGGQ
jgi:hypothetical protein